MTMRDKIARIVFGKLGAAFQGNTGNLLALELADAIIAALPDYEAQQARSTELEAALERIASASDYYGKEASDHDEFALAYAHQSTNRLAREALKGDVNED
jgi:hypothetical protein